MNRSGMTAKNRAHRELLTSLRGGGGTQPVIGGRAMIMEFVRSIAGRTCDPFCIRALCFGRTGTMDQIQSNKDVM